MDQQKWKATLGMIRENFEVEDEGHEHEDAQVGIELDFVEFQGPMGRMRLEYVSKPVVVDKKTTYSRRIGSETAIDYVYSSDERVEKLMVYTWSDEQNDWVEIDADSLKL